VGTDGTAGMSRRRVLGLAAGGGGALLLAACGQMPSAQLSEADRVATVEALGITVTVVAGNAPAAAGGAKVTIAGGQVAPANVSLSTKVATVLQILNSDDVAYTLSIDTLVAATEIAPKTTTVVGFTSPVSGRYNGYVKSADASVQIGQFVVEVRAD